jgi:hypothetical protein
VPTPSRWHPPPATADADGSGEDWEVVVPEVMKVTEVIKVREVVSRHPAMVEGMYASPSASHARVADAMNGAHAVHAAHTAHRVGGQCRWRGKHRHHDSTSDCYFMEHDNPPDCHRSPRAIVRTQYKIFK